LFYLLGSENYWEGAGVDVTAILTRPHIYK